MYIKMTLTKSTLNKFHGKDLTKIIINPDESNATYNKPIELTDRDSLGVRISLKGKIVWQFRYRYKGKPQRLSLGTYHESENGIEEARKKVSKLRIYLENGDDPKQVLNEIKKQNLLKADYTLIQLSKEWLESIDEDKYKSTTIENYKSTLEKWVFNTPKRNQLKQKWVINKLNIPFDEIRPSQWMEYFEWISKEGSPIVAGSVLKLIKTIAKWGLTKEKVSRTDIFIYKVNDVGRASLPSERTPSASDIANMWLEIERSKALPQTKLCLKLIIIFGGRNTAVRTMKWEHLDFDNMVWTIPQPKKRKEQPRRAAFEGDTAIQRPERHPIPEIAQNLLKDYMKIYGNKGNVFRSESSYKPLSIHAIDRFCLRMSAKLFREKRISKIIPHDFRRSLHSILCEIDKDWDPICEKILGHKLRGTKAHYNKADYLSQQLEALNLYWSIIDKEIDKLAFGKAS